MALMVAFILSFGGVLVLIGSLQSIRTAPVRNVLGVLLAIAMIVAGVFLFLKPEIVSGLFR